MRLETLAIAAALVLTTMPLVSPAPADAFAPVTFSLHEAPGSFKRAHQAGETSIGVNPTTGAVMFLMRTDTARVTFDLAGEATWSPASAHVTSIETLDPVLWTDPATGRTFVSQLLEFTSLFAFTDDDGRSWTTVQVPNSAPGWDHQTVGGGPYPEGAKPVVPGSDYPHAVYYCAQSGESASCARSDDGGITWGAPVAFDIGAQLCMSTHGRVVVTPGGTVLLPMRHCDDDPDTMGDQGGVQGVFVSRDAGLTWELSVVPGTVGTRYGDPAIAVDAGGRVYFFASSAGQPLVAVSTDEGRSWSQPVNVGGAFGLQNVEFPMAVAGDAGRAAVAFYGTTTPGNDQGCACEAAPPVSPLFQGYWHLYESMTLDGGQTWTTVDVTPDDPVQHGCIWLGGGSNYCRNLFDFQGMTVDAQGRVLIGFADGCTPRACLKMDGSRDDPTTPSKDESDKGDSLGMIARQTSGPRLFAAFDPSGGVEPLEVRAHGPRAGVTGESIPVRAEVGGGVPPYDYKWERVEGGAFTDPESPSTTFQTHAPGTYTLAVRVIDAKGVRTRAQTTVAVTLPTPLEISAGGPYAGVADDPIPVTATAEGGRPPYAYQWEDVEGGAFADPQDPSTTFQASAPGAYQVAVRVTDAQGVVARAQATIAAAPPYALEASAGGPYVGVVGKPVSLAATVTGGVPAYSHEWSAEGGTLSRPNGARTDFSAHEPGTYNVTVRVRDLRGSEATAQTTVLVKAPVTRSVIVYDLEVDLGVAGHDERTAALHFDQEVTNVQMEASCPTAEFTIVLQRTSVPPEGTDADPLTLTHGNVIPCANVPWAVKYYSAVDPGEILVAFSAVGSGIVKLTLRGETTS